MFRVERVAITAGGYRVHLTGSRGECDCPACGTTSSRVHSRYSRTVRDLPIQGKRATLMIIARKYYCDEPSCSRRIFCERFPGVLESYARATARLDRVLMQLALMVSARLAARLSRLLGFAASASTLLRRGERFEPPILPAARIGVDDFAFRRGHHYGTIIIDLESHRPIEVLPNRDVATLRRYLANHPAVEVICRDRDARYAEAIAWEAPTATVVLDRWHLIRNLTDAVGRATARHHRRWTAALREHAERERKHAATGEDVGDAEDGAHEAEPAWLAAPAQEVSPREAERRKVTKQRRQDRYDRIAELAGKGIGKMEIARRLKLDRGTVASYLKQGGPPTNERRHFAPTLLDPFFPYLKTRFVDDGCRNAALLTREIKERGYTGSVRTVMRRIRTWKRVAPGGNDADGHVPAAPVRLPAPRTLAWQLLQHPDDHPTVELLKRIDEHAATLAELAPRGLHALRTKDLDAWIAWRRQVAASTCSDLKRYLRGLERDEAAVTNAITLPYSNGPTEGNVHRIKLIKRTMYGRASFQLLRKKILHHEA